MKYSDKELSDHTIFDFIDPAEVNEFNIIWKNIIAGVPFEGRLKMLSKEGDEKWFHGTFSTVLDMYGEIAKIIISVMK